MFKYAVIMAAGEGKRLKPLTDKTPKALLNINGKHLISYSLDQLMPLIENIYVTVGHAKTKMINFLYYKNCNTIDTSGKGNAWWLLNTFFKHVDDPVLVLPCDMITDIDLPLIFANYAKMHFPPCMLVPVAPVEGVEGDYIHGENGLVNALSRKRKNSSYCSGIQVINPNHIYQLRIYSEDFFTLWNCLIAKEMLHYSDLYPYRWYSINTEKQLIAYCSQITNNHEIINHGNI